MEDFAVSPSGTAEGSLYTQELLQRLMVLRGRFDLKTSSFFSGFYPNRWLTNNEIAAHLLAFEHHEQWISSGTPVMPESGKMFLYNRRKTKFRKDGHQWEKRADGKATREDHAKLKVKGETCMYGCYAHSAESPTFHRRCYWLLDNADVVLVHYLDTAVMQDGPGSTPDRLIKQEPSNGSAMEDPSSPDSTYLTEPILGFDAASLEPHAKIGSSPMTLGSMASLFMQPSTPSLHMASASLKSPTPTASSQFALSMSINSLDTFSPLTTTTTTTSAAVGASGTHPSSLTLPFSSAPAVTLASSPAASPLGSRHIICAAKSPDRDLFDRPHVSFTDVTHTMTAMTRSLTRILHFAPTWSPTFGCGKMLLVGDWHNPSHKFACLFGDMRVPAFLVLPGVLSCDVPHHPEGVVALSVLADGVPISEQEIFQFKAVVFESEAVAAVAASSNLGLANANLGLANANPFGQSLSSSGIGALHMSGHAHADALDALSLASSASSAMLVSSLATQDLVAQLGQQQQLLQGHAHAQHQQQQQQQQQQQHQQQHVSSVSLLLSEPLPSLYGMHLHQHHEHEDSTSPLSHASSDFTSLASHVDDGPLGHGHATLHAMSHSPYHTHTAHSSHLTVPSAQHQHAFGGGSGGMAHSPMDAGGSLASQAQDHSWMHEDLSNLDAHTPELVESLMMEGGSMHGQERGHEPVADGRPRKPLRSLSEITWQDFLDGPGRDQFSRLTIEDHLNSSREQSTPQKRLEYRAARTIQHAFRRYLQAEQKKKEMAALVIQNSYRRYKKHVKEQESPNDTEEKARAAITIQSHFRAYREQARYRQTKHSAVVIQRSFRKNRQKLQQAFFRKTHPASPSGPAPRLSASHIAVAPMADVTDGAGVGVGVGGRGEERRPGSGMAGSSSSSEARAKMSAKEERAARLIMRFLRKCKKTKI